MLSIWCVATNKLVNGVRDDEIFYYGLDEDEIKRIIKEGDKNDHVDFVITSY